MGFDGFLISDWEGIDKLPGTSYPDKVARSISSGLDMGMAPYNFAAFIDAVVTGVGNGAISQDRVDDAVTRILTEKMDLGLFESPFTDDSLRADFGGADHRALARRAAAESQVLLRNDGALPLARTGSLYGRRLQRRRPGSPDGWLDHLLAGRLGPHDAGHHDPAGPARRRARPGDRLLQDRRDADRRSRRRPGRRR